MNKEPFDPSELNKYKGWSIEQIGGGVFVSVDGYNKLGVHRIEQAIPLLLQELKKNDCPQWGASRCNSRPSHADKLENASL